MDENINDYDALVARVQQLENEREALHKDIEQLCMQNAGPGYLAVATRMHFQRIATLEQEIENLQKKLAACMRENSNIQEELSEAYRIKSQLADLHSAEVLKNLEAEKQLKFFQGCVAAAFSERDHSIMEAEKAKEKENSISQKLVDSEKRVEVLTYNFLEEKKVSAALQIDLEKEVKQKEIFIKVVNKFYEIRQHSVNGNEDGSLEDKCECLLHDSAEMWSFNDDSTAKYITALESEVETLRKSVDNLQGKQKMALEIEKHLKKKVSYLEKKKILSEEKKKELSELVHHHSQHREHIINLLDRGYSHLKSIADAVEDKIKQFAEDREQKLISPQTDIVLNESECRDVHINNYLASDRSSKVDVAGLPNTLTVKSRDTSDALSQVLQEKVEALLLLSQQEERYILESNVNAALQKKTEELQRNLLQVTNEKVKALMELAQLKQQYHLLQESSTQDMKQENHLAETGEKRIAQARDGKLKNILKKTYLRRWIDPLDAGGNEAEIQHEGIISNKRSNHSMYFARMKIENAAMKESLESMEHLTSSAHRLRLSLLKVKEADISKETITGDLEILENIIYEAKLIRTALGSSLPISWLSEPVVKSSGECNDEDSGVEKMDCVSAAGFEMVELLILASQILLDEIRTRDLENVT